ncbi:Vacuolar protein sorting-associated protein ist1 [Entomophthora muscae]|uniref:Vacuolar protein sorting-associated protein ist1 n=1 Tax=Entomophthora muscae TaxID=34485 RepID=A0ACC2UJY0_9FUNG|nr:Vacuolar protein sorting-associated protein ist1 [Entomophthora muscae]
MFSPARLKIHLKLCVNRLKLLRAKKDALSLQARKEISLLLANNKEASARIRVESIIRDDDFCEVLEMLELYCELLLARFGLLETASGSIDSSLVEAVHGLMYSAARCVEVKELLLIRDQLGQKVGKEAYLLIINDTDKRVNSRIVNKLLGAAPNPILVERYLSEIGQRYNVPGWSLKQTPQEPDDTLISLEEEDSNEATPAKPPKQKFSSKDSSSFELPTPPTTKPNAQEPKQDTSDATRVPTFEELESRFRALKNKP